MRGAIRVDVDIRAAWAFQWVKATGQKMWSQNEGGWSSKLKSNVLESETTSLYPTLSSSLLPASKHQSLLCASRVLIPGLAKLMEWRRIEVPAMVHGLIKRQTGKSSL